MSSPQAVPDHDEGLIYEDGVIYDADGEIHGYYDRPENVKADGEPWFPTDADGVDFVLSLLANDEAELLALERREQAVLENIRSMKRKIEQRRDGRERWYRGAIEEVAREYLRVTGGKSKTLTVPHGKVSFRMGRESVDLVDEEAAIAWAKANKPELVHVKESVLKTELEPHVPEDCPFLKRNEPVERMTIATGVK